MDTEVLDTYFKIPMVGNKWICPLCEKTLIVNRPRLLRTQIKQHVTTFFHERNAKYEEKTKKRVEELEEIIEAFIDYQE